MQICNGTGRKDGNPQTVDNGLFDRLQIVHTGNHVQLRRRNAVIFQKYINFLAGTGTVFPENKRLLQKFLEEGLVVERDFVVFPGKKMIIDWRSNDKRILAEGNETAGFFVNFLADQTQVHTSVQNFLNRSHAVRLPGVKKHVLCLLPEGTQKLWKQVGGWDCGDTDINDFFAGSGKFFYQMIAHVQHLNRTVIKLISSCGNCNFLSSADDQAGIEFCLQRTDMGADRGLCQIKMACRFRKTVVFHDCNKCFQLFKFHDGFLPYTDIP